MGEEVEPIDTKVDVAAAADITSFDPSKKKKKKKKVVALGDPTTSITQPEDSTIDDAEGGQATTTSTSNRDDERNYTYEELIGRVFNMMRENNPEMALDKGGRRVAALTLRPPEVLREGTKKTVLVNFMDFCKRMHREHEHVMSFLLMELGTTGSLDGQQRLVVKGRFVPKSFEGLLRKYANEYVTCSACRSSNTILSKEENRLLFVRCEQCGSGRTVASINKGVFLASVKHRHNSRGRS